MNRFFYSLSILLFILLGGCQQLIRRIPPILENYKEEITPQSIKREEQINALSKPLQKPSAPSILLVLPFYRFQDLRFNFGFKFYLFAAYNFVHLGDIDIATRLYNEALEQARRSLGQIRIGEAGRYYSEDALCKIRHLEIGIEVLELFKGEDYRNPELDIQAFRSTLTERTRDLPCITYIEFDETRLTKEDYSSSNFVRTITYWYFNPSVKHSILTDEINPIDSKVDFYFNVATDLVQFGENYEIGTRIFEKALELSQNACEKTAIELAITEIEQLTKFFEETGEFARLDSGFSIRYIYSTEELPCVELVRSRY